MKVGIYRGSTLDKLTRDGEWAWSRLQRYCVEDDNYGVLPRRELLVGLGRKVSGKKAEQLMAELVEFELAVPAELVDLVEEPPEVVARLEAFPESWMFPRFTEENPPGDVWRDPVRRERWARDKRLKRDGELCRRIKDRDRHRCRYCGIRVNWNDRNGDAGGSYDHVDPDGENQYTNVVVACRACNSGEHGKRDRTVEQWIAEEPLHGRTLKKPGT